MCCYIKDKRTYKVSFEVLGPFPFDVPQALTH